MFWKNIFKASKSKDKKPGGITVYGTKEGKLYIKPEDLFSQKSVQDLIERVANSPALRRIHKKA